MLKRVFLAIAGLSVYNDASLLSEVGILETIQLGDDVMGTGYVPSIIFSDGYPTAVQSAYVMAGRVRPRAVIHYPDLRKGVNTGCPKERHNPLRESFRTPEGAHAFLRQSYPIKEDDETVLLMTDCCWGLAFGGTWPRSMLKLFYLQHQKLQHISYHGGGI